MPRDVETLYRNDEGFVRLMRAYIETSPDKHKTISDIKKVLDTIAGTKERNPRTGEVIEN